MAKIKQNKLIEVLTKLWRGEYSLPRVFWLFYVLVGGIWLSIIASCVYLIETYNLFEHASTATLTDTIPTIAMIIFILLLAVIVSTYRIILFIGIWRTAKNSETHKIWKFLAVALVTADFIAGIPPVIAVISLGGAVFCIYYIIGYSYKISKQEKIKNE